MAVELAWTAFMVCRPWSIDDERLRTLVEHPPVSRAALLGALLSIRFTAWACQLHSVFVRSSMDEPLIHGSNAETLYGLRFAFFDVRKSYEARTRLTITELSGLLEVDEPELSIDHEISRWRWMLYDYSCALDPQLHDCIEALELRYVAAPGAIACVELCTLRVLDACVGLLLARAAMLDPQSRPTMLGFVDAMSTRAHGSVAWWCQWLADASDGDVVLGERLRPDEIESLSNVASLTLELLNASLFSALLRVFPVLQP